MRDLLDEAQYAVLLEEGGLILQRLKELVNSTKAWSDFFAVLKIPSANRKHIEQRISTNLMHYRSNYFAILSLLVLFQIVAHPVLLLALLVVALFLFYSLCILKPPLVLSPTVIINQQGCNIAVSVCVFVFFTLCGVLERIIWTCIYWFVLSFSHMLLRPRSVTSKTSDSLYDEKRSINLFSIFNFNTQPTLHEPDAVDPEVGEVGVVGGSGLAPPLAPPMGPNPLFPKND